MAAIKDNDLRMGNKWYNFKQTFTEVSRVGLYAVEFFSMICWSYNTYFDLPIDKYFVIFLGSFSLISKMPDSPYKKICGRINQISAVLLLCNLVVYSYRHISDHSFDEPYGD